VGRGRAGAAQRLRGEAGVIAAQLVATMTGVVESTAVAGWWSRPGWRQRRSQGMRRGLGRSNGGDGAVDQLQAVLVDDGPEVEPRLEVAVEA